MRLEAGPPAGAPARVTVTAPAMAAPLGSTGTTGLPSPSARLTVVKLSKGLAGATSAGSVSSIRTPQADVVPVFSKAMV